jgi:mRNA-decapping enzyme 1B
LFVVKRSIVPHHRFIVMNRRSPENFVENIDAQFAVQNQDPYIMYRNQLDDIIGMWFYDAKEREHVAALLHG